MCSDEPSVGERNASGWGGREKVNCFRLVTCATDDTPFLSMTDLLAPTQKGGGVIVQALRWGTILKSAVPCTFLRFSFTNQDHSFARIKMMMLLMLMLNFSKSFSRPLPCHLASRTKNFKILLWSFIHCCFYFYVFWCGRGSSVLCPSTEDIF